MERTMQAGDLCLVTGVSGYLASWIAHDLQQAGYRVRGTVRSLADEDRLTTLAELLPGAEFVAADLRLPEGWGEAVKDCAWIFHVASPQAVSSETDRTGGAVQGTEFLMRAALGSPSTRKIVLTSSEAAIAYGHPSSKHSFTEDDWTILKGPVGRADYFRSKTLAERLAWELVADTTANPRGIPLSVVNPGFILGPSLAPWGRFSLETMKMLAEGRMPFLPDMAGHAVDVRDCAAMHIALMNDPATDGKRHFAYALDCSMADIAAIIRANYAAIGFAPRPRILPTWLLRLLKIAMPDLAAVYSKLGHPDVYRTRWPKAFLYRYTDPVASVRASMESMLSHGWILPANATG